MGAVTGSFTDANSVVHGYVRAPDGTFTIFDVPGSVSTGAVSINDKGTVVGSYATPTPSGPYSFHIFLRAANGTFTTFDAPVQSFVLSSGISSSNAVAGNYQDATQCFQTARKVYSPRALDWCFLAMAQHRLGQADEARRSLTEAKRWIDAANRAGGQ